MTARGKNISQDDSTSDPEPKIKQIEFIQDIVMTLIASENIIWSISTGKNVLTLMKTAYLG